MTYLPPGYSRRQRYPVYYLLHGMPGGPQHFMAMASMDERLVTQMGLHRARPMILCLPGRGESAGVTRRTRSGRTPPRAPTTAT